MDASTVKRITSESPVDGVGLGFDGMRKQLDRKLGASPTDRWVYFECACCRIFSLSEGPEFNHISLS